MCFNVSASIKPKNKETDMCGIAGLYNPDKSYQPDCITLQKMISSVKHRGPDEQGEFVDGNFAMGHARLSIIDLTSGQQPVHNEDKSIWVVFNGEIFNYIELRSHLEALGHRFYTTSDTEVIVHLYEQYGLDYHKHMNGQFAIALWDHHRKRLILSRDHIGICPVFYSIAPDNTILFASEMKALFCYPSVRAEIDPVGVDQTFSLWVTVPPRTVFKNISELSPGCFMVVDGDGTSFIRRYWNISFPRAHEYENHSLDYFSGKLHEILFDAITIRLRADVPVAAYLSGGIDSSIVSSLIKKHHNNNLITFSVAFSDERFDERSYQKVMVEYLNTDHRFTEATYNNIGNVFPDVIWHTERPLIRTAPAPLYLLSKLVRENNIKVVLTGEGADEIFGGYNIFKENKIRRFWARQPGSKFRPNLLSKLYPYINHQNNAFWQAFFKKELLDTSNPYYSHQIRWANTAYIKRFIAPALSEYFNERENIIEALDSYIDKDIYHWHPLCQAQYLEMALFLPGYLLSSQGDRMIMAHSVEGRFPFLDHRVIEFASTIPPELKINVLNEKYLLKKTFEKYVPQSVVHRAKHPYRAPISQCFLGKQNLTSSLLTPDALETSGLFDSGISSQFLSSVEKKYQQEIPVGEREEMTVAAMASMQLLHYHFVMSKSEVAPKINVLPDSPNPIGA
jgi:asparagine synthase (glutamine-hydrolysing)